MTACLCSISALFALTILYISSAKRFLECMCIQNQPDRGMNRWDKAALDLLNFLVNHTMFSGTCLQLMQTILHGSQYQYTGLLLFTTAGINTMYSGINHI